MRLKWFIQERISIQILGAIVEWLNRCQSHCAEDRLGITTPSAKQLLSHRLQIVSLQPQIELLVPNSNGVRDAIEVWTDGVVSYVFLNFRRIKVISRSESVATERNLQFLRFVEKWHDKIDIQGISKELIGVRAC